MNEHATNSTPDRLAAIDHALIAVASLPAMYPGRLRLMLQHHSPADLLDRLQQGVPLHPQITRRIRGDGLSVLRRQAKAAAAEPVIEACIAGGVGILVRGHRDYPEPLQNDPEAPELLYYRGDLKHLSFRRVGIVGTRNATAAGRATATEFGRGLADEGIAVVSGLARGIDAAAHHGSFDSPRPGGGPIAVVGCGPDIPYPSRNTELWEAVADQGLLLSEFPPGTGAEGWRFPLRNRILAALSQVLVVVESRDTGGSLITARQASERGIDVMAVPGSRHCRSAAGTNALLNDGAAVARNINDVLDALSLAHDLRSYQLDLGLEPPTPTGLAERVYHACLERPQTLDNLIDSLEVDLLLVARAVVQLEHEGWVRDANGWFEAIGSRLRTG